MPTTARSRMQRASCRAWASMRASHASMRAQLCQVGGQVAQQLAKLAGQAILRLQVGQHPAQCYVGVGHHDAELGQQATQPVADGRSAYEALADGEIDRVWDRVLGSEGADASLLPAEARMAY
jgi:hypothetical protein